MGGIGNPTASGAAAQTNTAASASFKHCAVSWGAAVIPYYFANHVAGSLTGSFSLVADAIVAVPFIAPMRGGTLDRLSITTFTANVGAKVTMAIYSNTSDTELYPMTKIVAGTEFDTAAAATFNATISQMLTPGLMYWLVAHGGTATTGIRAIPAAGIGTLLGCSDSGGATPYGCLIKSSVTYATPCPTPFPAAAAAQSQTPALAMRFSA
jgi:hypothetical protein